MTTVATTSWIKDVDVLVCTLNGAVNSQWEIDKKSSHEGVRKYSRRNQTLRIGQRWVFAKESGAAASVVLFTKDLVRIATNELETILARDVEKEDIYNCEYAPSIDDYLTLQEIVPHKRKSVVFNLCKDIAKKLIAAREMYVERKKRRVIEDDD